MMKWIRESKGLSLIEAPAAVIVLTIALLGACILYACSSVLDNRPARVGTIESVEVEAVNDLKQSGCALPFEPIAKGLGDAPSTSIQPTHDKGRS
jgi:hypothetical protein